MQFLKHNPYYDFLKFQNTNQLIDISSWTDNCQAAM